MPGWTHGGLPLRHAPAKTPASCDTKLEVACVSIWLEAWSRMSWIVGLVISPSWCKLASLPFRACSPLRRRDEEGEGELQAEICHIRITGLWYARGQREGERGQRHRAEGSYSRFRFPPFRTSLDSERAGTRQHVGLLPYLRPPAKGLREGRAGRAAFDC